MDLRTDLAKGRSLFYSARSPPVAINNACKSALNHFTPTAGPAFATPKKGPSFDTDTDTRAVRRRIRRQAARGHRGAPESALKLHSGNPQSANYLTLGKGNPPANPPNSRIACSFFSQSWSFVPSSRFDQSRVSSTSPVSFRNPGCFAVHLPSVARKDRTKVDNCALR